ncbi:ComF family protein [Paraburkholderia pallida]|uniref:ComF family protein n=1 Tax=Paraburkholderia pallida TaxID=2547399 RepID=A0A4P7CSW0_9BURK|nr:ComF family protein [Paraburkholderia pallida]QBQ98197.1 ComF family protein [Paraburkholderia pallida]
MRANVREIHGNWELGFALDKHTIRSTYIGDNEQGYPQFDTERSEAGEAVFRLKYRDDWDQVRALAEAVYEHICPRLYQPAVIVPMPASTQRARQPVTEVARALGDVCGVPVEENLLWKRPGGPRLKDLGTREEKVQALANMFVVADVLPGEEARPILLLDDLYDSGATAEAATAALLQYRKVSSVYLVTLTSKR